MRPLARLTDAALEASVVGSFSRYGYRWRRRLEQWRDPPAMTGARVLVTGATSGIGLACARAFALRGAAVRFVARDLERAVAARDMIVDATGQRDVDFTLADMADLEAVRAVAQWVLAEGGDLSVLVHNAGSVSPTLRTNGAGVEVTLAGQVLGPFLLTGLLLPALAGASPGRVITVSSGGMYTVRHDLRALVTPAGPYDALATYARVKRAQVVLNAEWARRVASTSVVFHSLHPGWVDTAGLRASLPRFAAVAGPWLRTTAEGVDTLTWLAAAPSGVTSSGEFWHDRRVRSTDRRPATRSADPAGDGARLFAWCSSHARWSPTPGLYGQRW